MSAPAPVPTLRALVVDDEEPARRRLAELLARHRDVEIAASCANGREAVEVLARGHVDIVFLDVQMPELDGFGVVSAIGADRMPAVIFTSAYSEFAVRAFEAYALDYLLKPIDEERFDAALDRARRQMAERRALTAVAGPATDLRLDYLIRHVDAVSASRFPDAIAVKAGAQYVVVKTADVDWIAAEGNYARLYVGRKARLLTKSLAALEKDVLDPTMFLRVHRSAIVNTTKIATVEPLPHGELTLVLQDGSKVQCSRRFRKRLEERLYFTT